MGILTGKTSTRPGEEIALCSWGLMFLSVLSKYDI